MWMRLAFWLREGAYRVSNLWDRWFSKSNEKKKKENRVQINTCAPNTVSNALTHSVSQSFSHDLFKIQIPNGLNFRSKVKINSIEYGWSHTHDFQFPFHRTHLCNCIRAPHSNGSRFDANDQKKNWHLIERERKKIRSVNAKQAHFIFGSQLLLMSTADKLIYLQSIPIAIQSTTNAHFHYLKAFRFRMDNIGCRINGSDGSTRCEARDVSIFYLN